MKVKDFLRKNKRLVAFAAVLLVVTILLCIPATIKVLAGVFGYAVYFYLVLAYAFFILSCKKIKIPVSKRRAVLIGVTVACALMTLHIGICGSGMVNANFGGYVGGSYEKATVAGVLFSLISVPVVLPCKYIASVIIFFLLTAFFGFLIIFPHIFETDKKPKRAKQHERTAPKPVLTEKQPEPDKTKIYDEELTKFKPIARPEEKPITLLQETETEEPAAGSREYALQQLFGKDYAGKSLTTDYPAQNNDDFSYTEEKEPADPYRIIDGVDAGLLMPDDAPYTNNYLDKMRKEAKDSLFTNNFSDDYARRYGGNDYAEPQKTVGEEIKETIKVNPYIPTDTIFETRPEPARPTPVYEERPVQPAERPVQPAPLYTIPPSAYGGVPINQTPAAPVYVQPVPAPQYAVPAYPQQPTVQYTVPAPTVYAPSNPPVAPAPESKPEPARVIQTQQATPAPSVPDLNIGDEPAEEIFNDERTVVAETDELPKAPESAFMNALRQTNGTDAPKPVTVTEEFTDTEEAETVHISSQPIREKPKAKREPKPAPEPKPEPPKIKRPYTAPPMSVFKDHVNPKFSPYVENRQELKEVFEVKLKNYNIDVTLVDVVKGPTITRCILDLSEKCSISKVFTAKQDIARLLKTSTNGDIVIVPKIPNSSYFAIEVPNAVKGIVSFKEVVASNEYATAEGDIIVGLGKTNDGKIIVDDIAAMPHALVAGSTGSGKSVCINAILASIFYRYSPDEVKLVLIDLKFVEMANFAGLPHMLFKDPINEIQEVINALKWLKEETFRRFTVFKDLHVRNLNEYNAKMDKDHRMPRIVIIIDEASELMTDKTGKQTVEATLSSLARVARAAGVHMLFATQNPVREVITGEIQNNLNTKIAFAVSDYTHSMVILKTNGAEKLLGKGDMLIKKGSDMQRAQCAFVSTEEIEEMVAFIKENNDCDFDEDMIERILHGSKEEVPQTAAETAKPASFVPEKKNFEEDPANMALAKEALRIFVNTGKVSATYIQRRFSKGYNTIANVMDYLTDKGYISEQVNNKRNLLITAEEFKNLFPDDEESSLGE